MKIKTIWDTRTDRFDDRVNKALEEGWALTKRFLIEQPEKIEDSAFLAELVLPDPPVETPEPEAPDLLACMRAIFDTCDSLERCAECPLENYCLCQAPPDWKCPPEVKE